MDLIFESKIVCTDGSDCALKIFFEEKNVSLEFHHGTDNKQKMVFTLESFEDILNFIKQYGDETVCDYTIKCRDSIILNMHIEDETEHLFIKKDKEEIAIHKKHIYTMYMTLEFLFEMLKIVKNNIFC